MKNNNSKALMLYVSKVLAAGGLTYRDFANIQRIADGVNSGVEPKLAMLSVLAVLNMPTVAAGFYRTGIPRKQTTYKISSDNGTE